MEVASRRFVARHSLVACVLVGMLWASAARVAAQTSPTVESTTLPSFAVGAHVEVSFLGRWYPATIVAAIGGRFEIAYDNYPADWNQLVGPERIRLPAPPPPPPLPTPPPPPPGRAIAHLARLGPGTHVLVESRGTWYAARVVRALSDRLVRVHYVGWDHSWDESVDPTRVRLPIKS